MARSQESFQKRAREKARQEKKAEKKARREARSAEGDDLDRADENALMEEFATLSERFEANEISAAEFNEERHRIFAELGLEQDY